MKKPENIDQRTFQSVLDKNDQYRIAFEIELETKTNLFDDFSSSSPYEEWKKSSLANKNAFLSQNFSLKDILQYCSSNKKIDYTQFLFILVMIDAKKDFDFNELDQIVSFVEFIRSKLKITYSSDYDFDQIFQKICCFILARDICNEDDEKELECFELALNIQRKLVSLFKDWNCCNQNIVRFSFERRINIEFSSFLIDTCNVLLTLINGLTIYSAYKVNKKDFFDGLNSENVYGETFSFEPGHYSSTVQLFKIGKKFLINENNLYSKCNFDCFAIYLSSIFDIAARQFFHRTNLTSICFGFIAMQPMEKILWESHGSVLRDILFEHQLHIRETFFLEFLEIEKEQNVSEYYSSERRDMEFVFKNRYQSFKDDFCDFEDLCKKCVKRYLPNFFEKWKDCIEFSSENSLSEGQGFEITHTSYHKSFVEAVSFIKDFFDDFSFQSYLMFSNKTGLHINISMRDESGNLWSGPVNPLKGYFFLNRDFVFLGNEKRTFSSWATSPSFSNNFIEKIKKEEISSLSKFRKIENVLFRSLKSMFESKGSKAVGFNFLYLFNLEPDSRRIEFRFPGNVIDYNTLYRQLVYFCYITRHVYDSEFMKLRYIGKVFSTLYPSSDLEIYDLPILKRHSSRMLENE